jgi:hypothetical protein
MVRDHAERMDVWGWLQTMIPTPSSLYTHPQRGQQRRPGGSVVRGAGYGDGGDGGICGGETECSAMSVCKEGQ